MLPLKKEEKHYTYADYANRGDNVRYELIDGVIYMMAPPSSAHQRISRELLLQLGHFLRGKPCEVFAAPFSVRLSADAGDDTVVEPDLLVVCDKSKIDKKGCNGAPDMVIEIVSPSSGRKDRVLKLNKYSRAGVREYWIVDPDSKTISVHTLENGRYVLSAHTEEDVIPVHTLEGCRIDMKEVFADIEDFETSEEDV